jgi:outer membrane PBP1 activator LpoA protein
MPWAIAPGVADARLRTVIKDIWPVRYSRVGRLYAMGFDAYRLIPLVANSVDPLNRPVPGLTGLLSMDAAQRIHRELYWAVFRNGEPRLLPPPEEQSEAEAQGAATAYGAPRN